MSHFECTRYLTRFLSTFCRPQVATCSGANAFEPWVAIFTGIIGAVACQCQIILFENYLFIDDPLNASAVHLAAGGAGMIWVAFAANPDFVGEEFAGIFYGGDAKLLGYQIYGLFVYCAWTLVTSGAMFYALKMAGWFRISEQEEMEGADLTHHGGKAYPIDDEHTMTGAAGNSSESDDTPAKE
jgi:Amt family ammonium transporter